MIINILQVMLFSNHFRIIFKIFFFPNYFQKIKNNNSVVSRSVTLQFNNNKLTSRPDQCVFLIQIF